MASEASADYSIAYLCLQVTKEGQASYAHVHEIIAGLRSGGFGVMLFEPRHLDAYGPVARLREFAATQRRLRADASNVDAVYIRSHFACFPTARWARRRGIPVIQEVNGPYEDLFIAWPATRHLAPLFTWLMRTQYRRADRVITVTEELGRWLEVETGRSDVEVVPNGANTDLFAPGAEVPRGLPSRYAVFVGALAEWQGLPTVLDAVSEAAWPPDVGLVIVGDGALREMAEEYARTDPLVTYLGRLPYAEVPGVLGGALTALVPMNNLRGRSDTGLSPLKLYEALACGVPVVATDFPGQAELVRDAGAGIVVPPSDAGALAAAVARLAADPESARAMGASGMAVVRERHSWAVRSRQTAEIVRSLLPRRGSGR